MEEGVHPRAGGASRLATTLVLVLMAFTLVLVVLSFPVGLYAVFSGKLSAQLMPGSFVGTYLWLGPVAALLPFTVPIGGLFLLLIMVYLGFLLYGLRQPLSPRQATREAFGTGIAALTRSPFFVILISMGFLNFTALILTAVSEAAAGPVGNPFSNVDPLLELGSLTFAPLREEIGFRLILVGLVALILSVGRPSREVLRALWRPSAAYEGLVVGGATSVIIWLATAASAATFGVCHVVCGGGSGWNWSKLPEATWGGVVLGYLYVKYGLHVAVLTHWGIDYLGSVYAFFGQAAYGVPVNSGTTEFLGQYLVDFDMLLFFGVACFILVVYLGVRRLLARKPPAVGLVDIPPPVGGGIEP